MALTQRQKQVLDFLADFVETKGYSPSYEEIATALELASLATVHKHVSALEAKHYVKRSFNQSRSLEVASKYLQEFRRLRQEGASRLEVPLLGRIAAGMPVESFASQEKLNFADFVGHADTYALEVRGDSMIDDHICSGDFVLVE
ncbi:MAG: S24 family peptidase, partial [Bryobacteraceae bacterium]